MINHQILFDRFLFRSLLLFVLVFFSLKNLLFISVEALGASGSDGHFIFETIILKSVRIKFRERLEALPFRVERLPKMKRKTMLAQNKTIRTTPTQTSKPLMDTFLCMITRLGYYDRELLICLA